MNIISESEIKRICDNDIYDEGCSLYLNEQVHTLDMYINSSRNLTFKGCVTDETNDLHEAEFSVEYDDAIDLLEIDKFECDCELGSAGDELCEHVVALICQCNDCMNASKIKKAFAMGKSDERFAIWEDDFQNKKESSGYEEKKEDATVSNASNSGENAFVSSFLDEMHRAFFGDDEPVSYNKKAPVKRKMRTTQALVSAMQNMQLNEKNKLCQEISDGDIKVVPILSLGYDKEMLGLKVGRDRLYTVKNISEFKDNVKKQRHEYYGKELSFVHDQSAFDRESLKLLDLVMNMQTSDKMTYGYWNGSVDRKHIDLSEKDIDDLLTLYEGKSIEILDEVNRYKSGAHVQAMVIRKNPILPVTIEASQEAGAIVTLPNISLIEGANVFAVYWNAKIYICDDTYREDMYELLLLMNNRLERKKRNGYERYTYASKSRMLNLSEDDYSTFAKMLMPALEKYTDLKIKDVDFTEAMNLEGEYSIYLDVSGNDIKCEAYAAYGDKKHNMRSMPAFNEEYRDTKIEYTIRKIIDRYFPETAGDGKSFLLKGEDIDRLGELINKGVALMNEYAQVFASDEFKKIKFKTDVKVTTGLSVNGNLLEVSWDVDGMTKDEALFILANYKKKKKYFRLKSGELLDLEAFGFDAMSEMQDALHLTKKQLQEGMAEIPLYRAMYLDLLMKENAEKLTVERDKLFEGLLDRIKLVREQKYEIPEGITAELRPYQKDGYAWARALNEMNFGGILADDMGLGKTLQMITYIQAMKQKGDKERHNLVVCPASLVYNWEAEFAKFAPDIKCVAVVGTAKTRKEIIKMYEDCDVLITSYDLLKRDIDEYQGKIFDCQIIDEAQYIKNPMTQASKSVKAINSKTRFALTGTPIENRLSELWSIFEYLMPGYLYSYESFKTLFEENILSDNEQSEGARKRLHMMVEPFLMRRLKKDVLKELPDKLEEIIYSKMDKKQMKLYQATEKNILINVKTKGNKDEKRNLKFELLAELTRLREICCDPVLLYDDYNGESAKLENCIDLVSSAVSGGHKLLLFSQFTSMLDIIEKRLNDAGITTFKLVGATTKLKRRQLVEDFQAGKADVFLISLKAGGTGLNLTAADVVVHYDPWWNVAAENQATDRAHRIGQSNKVTVYKLIAKDTIEERIIKLQNSKKELADKIISEDNVSISSLSEEDIMALFSHDE